MSKRSQKQLYLEKIGELERDNSGLMEKVEVLNAEISKRNENHEELVKKIRLDHETEKQALVEDHQVKIAEKEQSHQQENDGLKLKVITFEENEKNQKQTIKNQEKQLNEHELKKMAEAYFKQEVAYELSAKFWMKTIAIIAVLLVISTAISIGLANGKQWYDRFEFYLVDFIFLSAVWFCASQYSYYVHLRADYANRKTVAQSYHNILLSINNKNSETENSISNELKNKFVEKAADVLYAQSAFNPKEPLLTKEFIKNVAEIVKNTAGK